MIGPDGQRLVLTEHGETPMEAVERFLRLESQPAPDPSTLAATDVAAGAQLCGRMGRPHHGEWPVPAHGTAAVHARLEFAGDVAWVGSEVNAVCVGDRVLADGFRTAAEGVRTSGGVAWHLGRDPEAAAMPMPEDLVSTRP